MTAAGDQRDARRDHVVTAPPGAVVMAMVVLTWSKWLPYTEKVITLGSTHVWTGSSILSVGGVYPGEHPSWHAAISFTTAYAAAVWKALVAALLISAALQTWIPRRWLHRLLNRPGRVRSAAMAGLISMPSMMCTCCTAPVAVGMRRRGVGVAAAVAYWLGNPLLNPAVLVFLALVGPWQWAVTRVSVGALLVVGGAALVSWLTDREREPTAERAALEDPLLDIMLERGPSGDGWWAAAAARFARTLLRMSLVLLPEYLLVVMLVGAFRGWLLQLGSAGSGATWVLIAIAAVVGTLLVIPTGAEIPILHGLALTGMSTGVVGALLITLPTASLPGIAMVVRSLGWKTITATTAVVIVGGLLGAGVLTIL